MIKSTARILGIVCAIILLVCSTAGAGGETGQNQLLVNAGGVVGMAFWQ